MTNPKNTKQKILEAAFELFSSSSFNRVSIGDIIKKAGISKGGLFHYFDSKYDLAKEALFYGVEKIWSEPITKLNDIDDPYEKMRMVIDQSVDISIQNPKMVKFFLDVQEETLKKGDENGEWLDFFTQYIELFGNMLADCKVPNPQSKAMILLVSLDAVSIGAAHFPELEEAIDKDILKKEYYELFVGNYRTLATRGDRID